MDRDRLSQVQTADLTESKVNQDFVDWLKKSGSTYLLVLLVALTIFLVVVRVRQAGETKRLEAWSALQAATLPESLADIAADWPDVDQVARLALNRAADMRLQSVQLNMPVEALGAVNPDDPSAAPPDRTLTEDERKDALDRAQTLYKRMIDAEGATESGADLHILNAMFGLAAIEESRGNAEEAKRWYEQAASRAGTRYPRLAEAAKKRGANAGEYGAVTALPGRAEVTQIRNAARTAARTTISVDEALKDLITPPPAEVPQAP